jgi:DNA topoisomerase-2
MEYRSVIIVPGLLKIFDEVIVNALDHVTRTREALARFPAGDTHIVKRIDVSVDRATGQIIVENDGDGIDVEYHPTVGFDRSKNSVEVFTTGQIIPTDKRILIPELIFGSLLTSTNYDKEEEKTVAGKNGYGAKLTAIFSREFIVETVDHKRKKHFR